MKFNNFPGLLVNLLLVMAGLAFIVFPVKILFSVFEAIPYFTEGQNGYTKSAVENIFYKGERFAYGADITPVINDQDAERADLPAQVTPELVAKFVMAQAVVSTSMFEARFGTTLMPLIIGIFCAIGVVAVLLGISLILLHRKLDMVLGGKDPIKEMDKNQQNKSIFESNGKINWRLIAAILAATVLMGAGLAVYIKGQLQPFSTGGDSVCDVAVDGVCDTDCPPTPDLNADPDCAKVWQ
jgi:hypothetical protein